LISFGINRNGWPAFAGDMETLAQLKIETEQVAAAYKRGDYSTAFQICRTLSDQGDARAQYNLGQIMPSDGCKGDTVPLAAGRWYDFPEFGCHLGNVGLGEGGTQLRTPQEYRGSQTGLTGRFAAFARRSSVCKEGRQ
jgi:hypothetical protein